MPFGRRDEVNAAVKVLFVVGAFLSVMASFWIYPLPPSGRGDKASLFAWGEGMYILNIGNYSAQIF
jgi:hypothetical protein